MNIINSLVHHFIKAMLIAFTLTLSAQEENIPVIIELESAALGSDWNTVTQNDVTYVTISTNAAGDHPQNAGRVITMEVVFPAAQAYDLYVRCRVGPAGPDDDSFYYGNGFGVKNVTSGTDWIRANNIHSTGYTGESQVVDGAGAAGTNVWKWINISEYTGDEPPVVFQVVEGQLTQTFQIGGREDGFHIDKIAFARAGYYFTVANLDHGEAGSPNNTGEPATDPIAHGKPKFLGNIYSPSQVTGFANYWNQVTPENAGKWGSVEAVRDVMTWAGLDAAYDFAQNHDFPFRLHVLVWGNQQPVWMQNLTPAEQLEEIHEWFQALGARYPGVEYVEVVNEPLHDRPDGNCCNNQGTNGYGGYIGALGGAGATGWDWIIQAFTLARQYFPNAKLLINEYNIENNGANAQQIVNIANLLKAQNLIDGIGTQAHAFSTNGVSATTIKANLDILATAGLPIQVTEMDIDGPTDQVQLNEYQRVFPVLWEHPAVEGITLWGYRPGLWRPTANLIAADGVTERPALIWLRGYVAGTFVSAEDVPRKPEIIIYPNPVSAGEVVYVLGVEDIRHASLWDVSGRTAPAWAGVMSNQSVRIGDHLPEGIYILRVSDGGRYYHGKVVVR